MSKTVRSPVTIVQVALVTAVAVTACGDSSADRRGASSAAAAEPGSSQQAARPDTTAAGLWEYLQEVGYRDAWSLYPGKTELYEGQEPHGMLLTTYVNSRAHEAISGTYGQLPYGAVVIKENFRPDSTLAAITVMYKRDGYDPEHNDWYWVKYLPDGSVDNGGKASGRVPGCINCHGGMADNDYIMTGPLGGQ
ncbi:MAG: cytochrome P460 family protein [Candidatus Palauibacterales bacterium]|nr:cytochrome P460 family protein [Candidatus Palauibacterales bacterium]